MVKMKIVLVAAVLMIGIPSIVVANDYYVGNRAPLQQLAFINLPIGSVQAQGWLYSQLMLQKNGLTGSAEQLYSDFGSGSGWLGGSGDNWEAPPYYVKGLVALAYVLNDQTLKTKAQKWIDWIINSQKTNGDFGPRVRNWWPNMLALTILRDYYEATGDAKALTFYKNYMTFQKSSLPTYPLSTESGWAQARGGDNMHDAFWYYNVSGEQVGLDVAVLLNNQTNDWTSYYTTGSGGGNNHNHIVNFMQGLKQPAVWYQHSKAAANRDAFWAPFKETSSFYKNYGRPDGMLNGTEHLSNHNTTGGTELCAQVEAMLSHAIAVKILGDATIADHLELVAYNVHPADTRKDYKGLRYYCLLNQVECSNGANGFENGYTNGMTPGPHSGYKCCRSNMHWGWPKFVQHMWMATIDNGLAAICYGPSKVTAKVGAAPGTNVTITETTNYPFEEKITLTVTAAQAVAFPLQVRIPNWASPTGKIKVTINGAEQSGVTPGKFLTLSRTWNNNDIVELYFPSIITNGTYNRNTIAIRKGSLLFSLAIPYTPTNINTYLGGQFYETEMKAAGSWNYALNIRPADPNFTNYFGIQYSSIDATIPWSVEKPPVKLTCKAKKIPWSQSGVLAQEPAVSPIATTNAEETLTLVPFGSTELRISLFPVCDGAPAAPQTGVQFTGPSAALNVGDIIRVNIYTPSGRLVKTYNRPDAETLRSMRELGAGLYIHRYEYKDMHGVVKVLTEKKMAQRQQCAGY